MVRISDILKKKMQDFDSSGKAKPEEKKESAEKEETIKPRVSGETSFSQFAKVISPKTSTLQSSEQKPQDMQIAKVMQDTPLDEAHYENIHSTGIQLAIDLFGNVREGKSIDLTRTKDWVSLLINALVLKDIPLLNLFYRYTPDNYLYSHTVSVVIMSMEIGLGLGYNKSKLNELGLAAFLHDLGMCRVENIALPSRTLSEEEYNQIKQHPNYSVEILSHLEGVSGEVIKAVKEQHERFNGNGYPSGLKEREITEYGRIIAVADVYEALTHERTYRMKNSPHEAIKEMLRGDQRFFDPQILKVLISKIGIYPISSWIELNNGEIARVIETNDEFPLRPVVNIIFDSAKKRLDSPRTVNLDKQFNLFIKKPIPDEDITRLVKEKE